MTVTSDRGRDIRRRTAEPRRWGLCRALLLGVACLGLAWGGVGCGAERGERATGDVPAAAGGGGDRPDVIVVLVDCLRADHMGVYGYPRDTTPRLDEFARDAVVFEQAIAQANWTRPSVASLFTSLYGSQHQVPGGFAPPPRARDEGERDRGEGESDPGGRVEGREGEAERGEGEAERGEGEREGREQGQESGHPVPEELVTLAEAMKSAGYFTGALVYQAQIPDYLGFAQGFDVYDTEIEGDHAVLRRFDESVGTIPGGPFFAYLHLLGLHFPYAPPSRDDVFRANVEPRIVPPDAEVEEKRRLLRRAELIPELAPELAGLYDGLLRFKDRQLGRWLESLRRRGLYEDSMIVVTSDHGEAFWEHGTFKHGKENVYAELVRVPLIVKMPGGQGAGRRIASPVELIDVMPTILEVAGAEVPDYLAGRSLLGPILGEADGPPAGDPVFTEENVTGARKAVYLDGFKYVIDLDDDTVEVYDIRRDPGDRIDVAGQIPTTRIEEVRRLLDEWITANERFFSLLENSEVPLRPEELERLRALGYIQ